MRKLLSVLLVVSMLFACCAALADEEEAAVDFEGIEFSPLPADGTGSAIVPRAEEYAIKETTDKVIVSESTISVRIGSITLMLKVPDAYRCFTQDYIASIRSYATIGDPETLLNIMFENDFHIYLWDLYTNSETMIGTLETDRFCIQTGDMGKLDAKDLETFGNLFGQANGLEYMGSYKTDSATWMRFTGGANIFLTIVNSQYIVYYYNSAAIEDVEEILQNLTIFS